MCSDRQYCETKHGVLQETKKEGFKQRRQQCNVLRVLECPGEEGQGQELLIRAFQVTRL